MTNPRTPANQLYYGPLYARSYFDRNLAHIGGSNPKVVTDMRQIYGRFLSGLGSEDMSGATGYDPSYQGSHIYDLEKEDDTFGSGIFDPGGRGGTANPNMGVFASHYSLPGYIARDIPFNVQHDVTDITDGAAVVSIPAGGLLAVADNGRVNRQARSPATWRPAIGPPGWTNFDQVYVDLSAKPKAMGHAPQRVPNPVTMVPGNLVDPHLVPQVPHYAKVGYTSIVDAKQVPVGIDRAVRPVSPAAPDMPMDPQVPFVNTFNVDVQQVPLSGFGQSPPQQPTYSSLQRLRPAQSLMPPAMTRTHPMTPGGVFGQEEPAPPPEKTGPTALQLALGGLLLGAGVGLVAHTLSKRGARR